MDDLKFKMVRHIEEKIEDLSASRDGHIDKDEKYIIDKYYIPEILAFIENRNIKSIEIITSEAVRSIETSEEIKKLINLETDLPIVIKQDKRVEALHHGVYKEGVTIENRLFKEAKRIYIRETFDNSNPWYRYGDSYVNGIMKYPELALIFKEPGENQAELNIRLYRVVIELFNKIKNDPSNAILLSTHFVVMSRLLSLESIAKSKNNLFPLFYMPNGDLYKHEWDASGNVMKGYDFHDFFKINNYIFDINIEAIEKIRNAVETDLDLFIAGYMQRYGKEI